MKNININKKHYDEILKELTDKQAGEFVKGVCAYAFEGKPFITKDEYLKGLFMYAKRMLDISEMNSVNGKRARTSSPKSSAETRRSALSSEALW